MADVIDVTDQTFEAEVLQSDKPAIIDFWAEWCAPCRQISPIIKDLAEEYGDRVKVVKMDIDANPNTPSLVDPVADGALSMLTPAASVTSSKTGQSRPDCVIASTPRHLTSNIRSSKTNHSPT